MRSNEKKAVLMVDKITRVPSMRFGSVAEAAKELRVPHTTVSNMCNKHSVPKELDYILRFEDDFDPEEDIARKTVRPPVYALRGRRLRTFYSPMHAVESMRSAGIRAYEWDVMSWIRQGYVDGVEWGFMPRGLEALRRELEQDD